MKFIFSSNFKLERPDVSIALINNVPYADFSRLWVESRGPKDSLGQAVE